jgi:hypothetical protein
MKLFVVYLHGIYGGQWYCLAYAKTVEDAVKNARERYPITNDNYQEYEQPMIPTKTHGLQLEIDRNGISNYWFVPW